MIAQPLTRLNIFSGRGLQMRTFHITWITFFVCFFGWFGIAPLMPIVRNDLKLTQAEVGNIIIASVSITIFARLVIGWLCDKIGPRLCYSILLIVGSIPVMLIGLSNSYETFLLFRLAIGAIPNHPKKQRKNVIHVMWNARICGVLKSSKLIFEALLVVPFMIESFLRNNLRIKST